MAAIPPGWRNRFGGKLVLVLLDDKFGPSMRDGRSLWGVQRPLVYTVGDWTVADTITVPAGFVTDLASIPRRAWMILPPDGPWVKAAIIHDYLYATNGAGLWHDHPTSITRAEPYARAESDRILLEAIENQNVGIIAGTLITRRSGSVAAVAGAPLPSVGGRPRRRTGSTRSADARRRQAWVAIVVLAA